MITKNHVSSLVKAFALRIQIYCTVRSLLLEQYSVAGAPMLKVKFVARILLSNVFYTVFSQCKGLHQIVLHAGS